MATISEPESRTPRIDRPVLKILASRDQSGTEWCTTAMSSRTRTGMVVVRTQSKRRFGVVSSSRGNEYLNCPWGLKEEVLAESFLNGLEVDGGIEEGGLFATGAGTFEGVADLHIPHGLDRQRDDFLGH